MPDWPEILDAYTSPVRALTSSLNLRHQRPPRATCMAVYATASVKGKGMSISYVTLVSPRNEYERVFSLGRALQSVRRGNWRWATALIGARKGCYRGYLVRPGMAVDGAAPGRLQLTQLVGSTGCATFSSEACFWDIHHTRCETGSFDRLQD